MSGAAHELLHFFSFASAGKRPLRRQPHSFPSPPPPLPCCQLGFPPKERSPWARHGSAPRRLRVLLSLTHTQHGCPYKLRSRCFVSLLSPSPSPTQRRLQPHTMCTAIRGAPLPFLCVATVILPPWPSHRGAVAARAGHDSPVFHFRAFLSLSLLSSFVPPLELPCVCAPYPRQRGAAAADGCTGGVPSPLPFVCTRWSSHHHHQLTRTEADARQHEEQRNGLALTAVRQPALASGNAPLLHPVPFLLHSNTKALPSQLTSNHIHTRSL